jgi:hypothetical protein
MRIRHTGDRDTSPCYWFSTTKDLIREIEDYQARTRSELGPQAAGPLRIKARQCILSGVLGLIAGIGLLIFGIVSFMGPGEGPPAQRLRPVMLGALISLIGLWRLGQGIVLNAQAQRVS